MLYWPTWLLNYPVSVFQVCYDIWGVAESNVQFLITWKKVIFKQMKIGMKMYFISYRYWHLFVFQHGLHLLLNQFSYPIDGEVQRSFLEAQLHFVIHMKWVPLMSFFKCGKKCKTMGRQTWRIWKVEYWFKFKEPPN